MRIIHLPDDSGNGGQKQPQLTPRDLITNAQIGNLLSVIVATTSQLDRLTDDLPDGEEWKGRRNQLDGEVKIALESIAIKACSALEAVVEETKRFTLDDQLSLEKKMADSYDAATEFSRVQTEASRQLSRPSYIHRPNLFQADTGMFMAIFGPPTDLSRCVIGIGPTPDAALKCFDKVFVGEKDQALEEWIESQRQKYVPEEPPASQQKQNEKPVDEGSGSQTGEIKKRRQKPD